MNSRRAYIGRDLLNMAALGKKRVNIKAYIDAALWGGDGLNGRTDR